MKILVAITFVYGVLNVFCRLFKQPCISLPFTSLGFGTNQNNSSIGKILILFDVIFFYFSLIFQTYYWLFL